jgi:hypothetical protein
VEFQYFEKGFVNYPEAFTTAFSNAGFNAAMGNIMETSIIKIKHTPAGRSQTGVNADNPAM